MASHQSSDIRPSGYFRFNRQAFKSQAQLRLPPSGMLKIFLSTLRIDTLKHYGRFQALFTQISA
jgi:hypothetical protein